MNAQEWQVDLGADIRLEHQLGLGAGVCKRLDGSEGAQEFAHSAAAFLTLGSYTVEAREGNRGEVLYHGYGFTLNSLGMPNVGLKQLKEDLPGIVKVAKDAGKVVVVSVAGFNSNEFADLAEMATEAGADAVELNFGCPNVVTQGGGRKEIVSCCPELVGQTLTVVEERIGKQAVIWVKVSPLDPGKLQEVAIPLAQSELVKVVVSCNTWPNAFFFTDEGKPVITSGLAGMAGGSLLPIMLGQVMQWREALPDRIRLVGVGGVTEARDVRDCLRAGADAVAMVSHVIKPGNGPQVFSEILGELVGDSND